MIAFEMSTLQVFPISAGFAAGGLIEGGVPPCAKWSPPLALESRNTREPGREGPRRRYTFTPVPRCTVRARRLRSEYCLYSAEPFATAPSLVSRRHGAGVPPNRYRAAGDTGVGTSAPGVAPAAAGVGRLPGTPSSTRRTVPLIARAYRKETLMLSWPEPSVWSVTRPT